MADVNRLPGDQFMLSIWDKTATVPAWRPVACATSNEFTTELSVDEVEAVYTKCGMIAALQTMGALTWSTTASGFAVDETAADNGTKASYDTLLAAQKAEKTTQLADDWKISFRTDGVGDQFGKGIISSLARTGDAGPTEFQNFTLTVTGQPDSLSDTTTVTPAE